MKSQSATEFIVIFAAAMILVIITISLLAGSRDASSNVGTKTNELNNIQYPVGVANFVQSPAGLQVVLINNKQSPINVTDIVVDDDSFNTLANGKILAPKEQRVFYHYGIRSEINDTFDYEVYITYNIEGISQVSRVQGRVPTISGQVQQGIANVRENEIIAEDLLFYFRFDDNEAIGESQTNFVDEMGNFEATCSSCPTPTPINDDGYANFTGSQLVKLSSGLNGTTNFTYAAWFLPPETPSGYGTIFSSGSSAFSGQRGFAHIYGDAGPTGSFVYLDNLSLSIQVGSLANHQEWQHAVVRRSGTNVTFWSNGTYIADQEWSETMQGANLPYIGDWQDSSMPMNGSIDEVLFWNRSLTDEEIQSLYYRARNKLN